MKSSMRGELEMTVWDPRPELYGQGWGRLNLRSHGPVAGAVDREEDDDRMGHQEPITGDVWITKNTIGETVRLLEPQLCRRGGTIGHSVVRQVVGWTCVKKDAEVWRGSQRPVGWSCVATELEDWKGS